MGSSGKVVPVGTEAIFRSPGRTSPSGWHLITHACPRPHHVWGVVSPDNTPRPLPEYGQRGPQGFPGLALAAG